MAENSETRKKSEFAYERRNAWEKLSDSERNLVFQISEDYRVFLSLNKTERECVRWFDAEARKNGFVDISQAKGKPGEKVIIRNGSRNILLAVLGKESPSKGANMVVSHIDSPRLDLKPLPLIEDGDMALLKTHYYGGIKKYQWVNIPLAIHGTVVRGDGSTVDLVIGENADDPVFTINDILPHLAQKVQGEKKLLEGVEGENLRVLFANIPVADKDLTEKIKETALRRLHEQFGITEEDFISAELEIVPAFPARDVGIDRSMVGGYGHDDRVCAYVAFRSVLDFEGIPERTAFALLVDKEEIGSTGVTGIRSRFLYNSFGALLALYRPEYRENELREGLADTFCLSGDVGGVINPMFKEVFDPLNSPHMGFGVILEKYTGSRGKSGASDASAELMGKVRKIWNDAGIVWQTGGLGKVDEGGGGTVALFLADLGIQVVDAGVGVDGMHSPFETVSKVDIYQAYRGYGAFLKDA